MSRKLTEKDYLENNNTIIIHDNKHAQIITTDTVLFNKLKNYLSFKAAGVEYTAAFKNGWSGINYLLDKNGGFQLGLLTKVQAYLANKNLTFKIIDNRKEIVTYPSIDLSEKIKPLGMEPREYQTRIVNAVISNKKGIVRACTGSGKTLIMALVTAHFNKPTIIYVIGLDLLKQFHDLFTSLFDEPIGYIGNGVCEIHRINIASIWTVSSALKNKSKILTDDEMLSDEIEPTEKQATAINNMLTNTKLHIFDESHVVTTDTIKAIFNKIDPENIYGFSGTPFRDDNSDLLIHSILGEQIINVPASELIAAGYLAQPFIKFVRVSKIYESTTTSSYATIYKEYIAENSIRNKLIVKNAIELLDKNYQVLILFKQLNHGKNIASLLDEKEIKYEYLSGSDPLEYRLEVKANMMNKKCNLLLASSIFDIGVDLPSLSALILAGGGKSSIRALQRIGRVIRKYPGKKHAAIVDFYDDVKILKGHSKIRNKIYKSEDGFKIMIPSSITDL